MFQIIFNELSASEISQLSTMEQLDLLAGFKVEPHDLENLDGQRFGAVEHKGRKLYRYRAGEYRIYFAVQDKQVVVHRVLHANTFKDFLFRTKLGAAEDEELGKSRHFWKLIDAAEKSRVL